jgi:hypothetical protein
MAKVTPISIENNLDEISFKVNYGNKFNILESKADVDKLMNECLKTEKEFIVKSYNQKGFVKETKYLNENNSWVEVKPMINETYVNKFKKLVEYQIKPSVSSATVIDEDEEEIQTPPSLPTVQPFEDTEAISQVQGENPVDNTTEQPLEDNSAEIENLAKEDDITRIKEIQDMQTLELNNMLQTVEMIKNEIATLSQKTVDIDAMKANIDIVNKKVKDLTPLSTEEQLTKNAIISGGMKIEDVWNKYLLDNDIQKAVSDADEDTTPELEKYTEEIKNVKRYNDNDIKKSFNLN